MTLHNGSEIGATIKRLREERGWSQRELARRMNMEASSLNRIEKGTGNLRVQTIQRFANVFQVEPTAFLQDLVLPPSTQPNGIPAKIRSLREERGWSQRDLARRMGVDPAWLSKMENGTGNVGTQTLQRLATAFEVEPTAFLQALSPPADSRKEGSESSSSVFCEAHAASVGEKIRALRKARGWTLKDFAERAGYSQPYLSELERGEIGYKVETIKRIAEVFHVSPHLLQDPDVDSEEIGEVSTLLSDLLSLPSDKRKLVHQMILAIRQQNA